MDDPAETAVEGAAAGGRRGDRVLLVGVGVFLALAVALTFWRLRQGADLVDEAFSVLVPWRWALGDTPFVDEQNLSQAAGLLAYPFVKVYAVAGGEDVTGLVLYERHLFLALGLVTAWCVVLLARRSLAAALALLVAAPFATVVLFETPQLTPNTLAALLLSAGAALGGVAVLGGSRGYAVGAGVAYGLAGVAYPTVALLAPFVGVFLAASVGDRAVGLLTPGPAGALPAGRQPTGRTARRVSCAWAAGMAGVIAPALLLAYGLAGAGNLRRCWHYTLGVARELDQLGGAAKAVEISSAFVSLLAEEWFIVVAAVAALGVYRARPGAGRWLLLLTPPALWLTATTSDLRAAGAVIMYALAAPYLYCFVPEGRREEGARLLVWIWLPALLLGAMTAYTSADGLEHAAVGLFPGLVTSGLFLAWALAPLRLRGGGATPWVAAVGLGAVVLVALAAQVRFLPGGSALEDLSRRSADGPWRGIALTSDQVEYLGGVTADLVAHGRTGDRLLAYPRGAAAYLQWDGEIAANTYQLYAPDPGAPLPKATISYYRRHREVPTLVLHRFPTDVPGGVDPAAASGGLGYPPVAVRPGGAVYRKPPADTVPSVLARLPRLD